MWGSYALTNAGHPEPTILHGQISKAPSGFNASLQVTIPDWRTDHYFTITNWPASHGATLPAIGNACLLIMEPISRQLWLVAWMGVHS